MPGQVVTGEDVIKDGTLGEADSGEDAASVPEEEAEEEESSDNNIPADGARKETVGDGCPAHSNFASESNMRSCNRVRIELRFKETSGATRAASGAEFALWPK